MKNKITQNAGLKILSFLVAVLIWFLISNINNPVKSVLIRDVRVKIENQDSVAGIDKVIVATEGDTVVLKVTEHSKVVENLTKDDFTVVADMENLTDMNSVPLAVTCSNPAVTWDEIEVYPSSMKVELENMTQAEFVVTVSTSGTPEKGFEVGTTEVQEGKTVQIAGPESMLKKIGRVSATVNVNKLRANRLLTTQLRIFDKNEDEFTESQMNRLQIKDSNGFLISENKVNVKIVLWEVKNDIAVDVRTEGTPAEGYRINGITTVPATLSLVGTADGLNALDGTLVLSQLISVEGAAENITQEIDLTEILAEMPSVRLIADADPMITVTVQIEKDGDRTIQVPLSEIELLNRPENMVLTVTPADAISLRIHSEDESVYQLKAEQIHCTVDLSVCQEAGTYEIPVAVELPERFELTSEVKIMVTSEQDAALKENEADEEG